ncbi:MAG: dienelactone hydrolase family protein [Actinobacteria bacterium]|nr:dienelactone hydrolase family protein [Actinomycetota bacterium]
MGEIVQFPSNGHEAQGYLSVPAGGAGPGLVVIQEWWGLVPHVEDVCDRFAAERFVALAPDLYHGKTTTEPDEAGKLMMAMNLDQAGRDMAGAVHFLQRHDAVTGEALGVTGFCMGGGLALVLACQQPEAVKACVPWYGIIPWEHAEPDWSALQAKVLGHFASEDGFFTPDKARALESKLRDLGKDVRFEIHEGADHAFFNDTRPEVYDEDAARAAWASTISFLHDTLG